MIDQDDAIDNIKANIDEMKDAGLEFVGDPTVVLCHGPPVCDLTGEAAFDAQMAGCPWCKRVIVHEDGTETVVEPARA